MPKYEKCDSSVHDLAKQIMNQYDDHKPLTAVEIKLDLVFAFADLNDKGIRTNDAITKNGLKVLAFTRVIPIKDRVLGRGDAEICLDGDHWGEVGEDEQTAILDHELHHISIQADKNGNIKYDDINRPLVRLRKHDVEVGWFSIIAQRHGIASQERIQAKNIMDRAGQYYWPDIAPTLTITTGGKSTGPLPIGALTKAAATTI